MRIGSLSYTIRRRGKISDDHEGYGRHVIETVDGIELMDF